LEGGDLRKIKFNLEVKLSKQYCKFVSDIAIATISTVLAELLLIILGVH